MAPLLEQLPFLLPLPATSPILAFFVITLSIIFLSPGGVAWVLSKAPRSSIPGPAGMTLALSGSLAHRVLSKLSTTFRAVHLMAFSVGFTRFIISSHPDTAKEILGSSAFADRPIKESAYELLFNRAMGFAPFGEYWRNLRRISATHLFCPRRIASSAPQRAAIGSSMVREVGELMRADGQVTIKKVLHFGSLNNVMLNVFGKKFNFGEKDGVELEELVREGYELLGVFNWADHFPLLGRLDLQGVRRRCRNLVSRVNVFVGNIIEEHKNKRAALGTGCGSDLGDDDDFVDVLLNLEKEERISDSDMVAVLWEMIFRGTDTVAILLEWTMARMVMHPEIQQKAQAEIDAAVGGEASSRPVSDSDIPNLPYLQAIVKETLRMHPPGPLLSWARLAVHDVHVGGHFIPAGTTAMVNMWAITHDERIWSEPDEFKPERFLAEDVSILGSDLRLAPFGSGRRVCPGKALGLATVHLWLAQLLQSYEWSPASSSANVVDLDECLKMSLEMKNPLLCKVVARL